MFKLSSLVNSILKQAQVPDEPPEPDEETEIEFESIPLFVRNTLTKIRIRPANFQKYTKTASRGVSTYKLYFKQTIPITFVKQHLKAMDSDRNFKSINYDRAMKAMFLTFDVLERTQVG